MPNSARSSPPSCVGCSRSCTSAGTPTEPATELTALDELPNVPKAPMTRSIVKLPADASEESEVYVNSERQQPDIDFCLDGRELIFDRVLRRNHVSGRRWFLGPGAWAPPAKMTQSTSRYEANGEIRVEHATPIALSDEPDDES